MNNIHETAIVSPKATIGKGNTIGAYTIIHDNVYIGDNNFIDSHVSIGSNGEIRDCKEFNGFVRIGDNNVIKEFVITVSTGVKVGGWVEILSYSNIGLNSVIHQRLKIGRFVMVGMGSVVTKNIIDFSKISGNPCRLMGMNGYMIDKHDLPVREISQEFILALDTVDNTYLTKWKQK
jgi:acyl-[acyl carrier protein]--UDP-N-acetylglucosamine O-acyltransferase